MSEDDLKAWYRQGRVRPEYYVFHPVLEKWMYVADLRELEGTSFNSERVTPPREAVSTSVLQNNPARPVALRSPVWLIIPALVAVGLLLLPVFRSAARKQVADNGSVAVTASTATAESADERFARLRTSEEKLTSCHEPSLLLSPQVRAACADAAISIANTALIAKQYSRARLALADAETFGAGLSVVRALRARIPGYSEGVASVLPSSEPSPAVPVVRLESLDMLVRELDPLFTGYQVVGPASIAMHVNASAWNSLSSDQQQQLGDVLASKAVVQSTNSTLHLYVYNTEVGTIGPGWTGQWRFRRN